MAAEIQLQRCVVHGEVSLRAMCSAFSTLVADKVAAGPRNSSCCELLVKCKQSFEMGFISVANSCSSRSSCRPHLLRMKLLCAECFAVRALPLLSFLSPCEKGNWVGFGVSQAAPQRATEGRLTRTVMRLVHLEWGVERHSAVDHLSSDLVRSPVPKCARQLVLRTVLEDF